MSWWRSSSSARAAAPPPAPSRLPGVLAGLRRRVAERFAWVNDLTAREVLAAGTSVNEIVDRATRHIAWLREVLGQLGGDHEVNRAIRVQSDMIREHTHAIGAQIAAHDEHTHRALEQVAHTVTAANVIARLTDQARTLALNARIEAAHAGDAYRGFAVIAEEMVRLSKAVAETNARIQGLAGSLGEMLPKMADQARDLRERATSFAEAAGRQIDVLDGHVAAMRTEITATVSASDETLAHVIASSHAALSHLQFQDVAAQRVLQVDDWMRDAQIAVLEDTGHAAEVAEVAPAVHVEEGGGYVDDSRAGDVLLF